MQTRSLTSLPSIAVAALLHAPIMFSLTGIGPRCSHLLAARTHARCKLRASCHFPSIGPIWAFSAHSPIFPSEAP